MNEIMKFLRLDCDVKIF